MKTIILLILTGGLSFSSYISPVAKCDDIPPINVDIIDFINTKMNKKVGSGNSLEVVVKSLEAVHARRSGDNDFGREVNHEVYCVFPGDIIKFDSLQVEILEGEEPFLEEYYIKHAAIIYDVHENGTFTLAHQDFSPENKKLGLSKINLKSIRKGKFKIYRAQK